VQLSFALLLCLIDLKAERRLSLSVFGDYLSVGEAARRAPTTRTSRRSAISF